MPETLQPAPLATRISWTPAASKPDAEITYLLVVEDDGHRDWCSGWWDGEAWRDCATGGVIAGTVVCWGDPELPQ